MSTTPSPTRRDGGIAQVWRPVGRTAALVIWGLWAMGTAAGMAWAAPARGQISCGAAGAQLSPATALGASSAHITLNTPQGTAGTKLLVHGTGWPAQAQVTVDEEGNGPGILGGYGVEAVAAADGTFDAPAFAAAPAPCGFPPPQGLVAQIVARTADQQVSATAPFTYIAAAPTLVSAFAQGLIAANMPSVSVEGANWDAGVVVTLWASPQLAALNSQDPWQPPASARTALAQADTHGDILADVPLPTGLRPGTVIVVGASATSARYGELTMTLSPLVLSPPIPPALKLDRTQGPAGSSVTVSGSWFWPGDVVTLAYCRGVPLSGSQSIVRCSPFLIQVLGQALVDRAGSFTARVTLPRNARTGLIMFEAYAMSTAATMSDPYTLTTPFHIVAPAQAGWQRFATVHPRAARALALGTPVVLGLLGLVGAAWWVGARRRRGLRPR